jgi:hypothetical protein
MIKAAGFEDLGGDQLPVLKLPTIRHFSITLDANCW